MSRGVRPPRGVIGAQVSHDEEMFGRVFDGRVMRRFFSFVWPYQRLLALALIAVLVFVATQLAIPLVILYAIDHVIQPGSHGCIEQCHYVSRCGGAGQLLGELLPGSTGREDC